MTRLDIRCACSRHTLLARGGVDAAGLPFIHQRVFKQSRIFGQMIAKRGTVHLWCRDCGRWTRINIRDDVEVNHHAVDEVTDLVD